MKNIVFFICGFVLLSGVIFAQEVKLEAKPITLPTYEIGEPEVNPIYYTGRVYQGAQGHIYPYPLYDVLTDNKVDKEYNALYLENDFVKLCVLPEIGGRILSATDKTNGYEFFYKQNVVKPALIGMLGAWMSGGVEWNIPHHHRPSSFMPIDWKTQENPDGSKTIWIGETEFRHRMKWTIGLTLHPGSSLVEAKVKIMNRSPLIQSFLYWANVSVHCDENYQVIFPPGTRFGTGHSKVDFVRWPINDGKDISWWKNFTENSASVFAWDFDNDFFAGYDHAKKAGTMHVANHHVVGGKKFFLWGNNPSSFMWEKMLTDDDGQYLELMVGAFSDNQPDYSWIYPGEIREFEQYWYPIRDIRSVKAANKNAAVNLERLSPDKVFIGINTTRAHKGAKVKLYGAAGKIFEATVDIDPATPFTKEIEVPDGFGDDSDLRLQLFAVPDKVIGEVKLIEYRPVKVNDDEEMPKVVDKVKPAAEYETVEELYLTGLRIEQFHNARLDPMLYYNEALKRDPNDSRVNTAVGIRLARQAKWEEAEQHLRCAVDRLSKNYTVPRDNEANYYLGYVLEMQDKLKEAKDQYWKATWSTAYQSAAYFALARIEWRDGCGFCDGSYETILDYVKLLDKSLETNSRNTKALVMKAYMLRFLERKDEARKILDSALEIDPLDLWAVVEKGLLDENLEEILPKELFHRGKGFVQLQEILEVALEYESLYYSAIDYDLLRIAVEQGEPFAGSALLRFYEDYFWLSSALTTPPIAHFKDAIAMSPDGSFPFRPEEIAIFEAVIEEWPDHPAGYYYLGNLLYYLEQKEKAIENWEKAAELDPKFGQVLRNLGFAYMREKKTDKAIAAYEKAVSLELVTSRLLVELDRLYETVQKPVTKRLALYEKHEPIVMQHDDAVIRFVSLLNQAGRFDRSISILDTRHFHVWEGGGEVHRYFVDAHLLAGMKKMHEKDFAAAVKEFETADSYPENLEVGRPSDAGAHNSKVFYFLGKAYQGLKNDAKAKESFETASKSDRWRSADERAFFRGMSLKELGDTEGFEKEIKGLADGVKKQRESKELIDQYSKFGEDGSRSERIAQLQYLSGLIHLARGEMEQAEKEFQTALQANPDLIWARQFLDEIRTLK